MIIEYCIYLLLFCDKFHNQKYGKAGINVCILLITVMEKMYTNIKKKQMCIAFNVIKKNDILKRISIFININVLFVPNQTFFHDKVL